MEESRNEEKRSEVVELKGEIKEGEWSLSRLRGGSRSVASRRLSALADATVGADPSLAVRAVVLDVLEGLDTERYPEEEERQDEDAGYQDNEEGQIGEEAVHESKVRLAVMLKELSLTCNLSPLSSLLQVPPHVSHNEKRLEEETD